MHTMPKQIPTFGLIIAFLILFLAIYISTKVESSWLRFGILFVAIFFVASAFMGLSYENRIVTQIVKAGYIDKYVAAHGVGNQKTFKALIQELKGAGYKINPRVEKILWDKIKEKTGYSGYQNSV